MKFMRWVIEVRPFRLVVDCMASYFDQPLDYPKCKYPLDLDQMTTHGFSNSILIRKPWSTLNLVLLSE